MLFLQIKTATITLPLISEESINLGLKIFNKTVSVLNMSRQYLGHHSLNTTQTVEIKLYATAYKLGKIYMMWHYKHGGDDFKYTEGYTSGVCKY